MGIEGQVCLSTVPHASPLIKIFLYQTLVFVILSYLVLDIEGATPWYVITMSWPNVPCAKLHHDC